MAISRLARTGLPLVCFVREALPGAAVVDEQDLIALIDFKTGITVNSLGEESPAILAVILIIRLTCS